MSSTNPLCKIIEYLHRKCSGHAPVDKTPVPLKLREASHQFANEASVLQAAATRLRKSADALSDLADHMDRRHHGAEI
jgi:hypothetical protein